MAQLVERSMNIGRVHGAVAQLARAPRLQRGGQEFESPQLHHSSSCGLRMASRIANCVRVLPKLRCIVSFLPED
jgi:hypothetical protein